MNKKKLENEYRCPKCGSGNTVMEFEETISGDDRQEFKCRKCGLNRVTRPPYTAQHSQEQRNSRYSGSNRMVSKPLTQRYDKVKNR